MALMKLIVAAAVGISIVNATNPLTGLDHFYTRLPITNDWHYVEIWFPEGDLSARWSNAAGFYWDLESNGTQVVAPNSPYGSQVVGVQKQASGQVTGVVFLGELYSVSPLSRITGSYQRLPVTNTWHNVTITSNNSLKTVTWANDANVNWQLEIDAINGNLIAPTSPYGYQVLSVNRAVDGSVTGVLFQDELYTRV